MRRGKKSGARSSHGHNRNHPAFPAQWFYVLSPAIGLFCHRHLRTYRKLDTSVEMSGPHDFTVRSASPVSRAKASTASHPDVRDVRETPLWVEQDAMDID